jgi:hypothetical protein
LNNLIKGRRLVECQFYRQASSVAQIDKESVKTVDSPATGGAAASGAMGRQGCAGVRKAELGRPAEDETVELTILGALRERRRGPEGGSPANATMKVALRTKQEYISFRACGRQDEKHWRWMCSR